MPPEVVLLLFLPVLLSWEALAVSLRTIRRKPSQGPESAWRRANIGEVPAACLRQADRAEQTDQTKEGQEEAE